jgi:hypothetical protein
LDTKLKVRDVRCLESDLFLVIDIVSYDVEVFAGSLVLRPKLSNLRFEVGVDSTLALVLIEENDEGVKGCGGSSEPVILDYYLGTERDFFLALRAKGDNPTRGRVSFGVDGKGEPSESFRWSEDFD